MFCKMWGFHGGDYEECRLLGCGTVYILREPKTAFFIIMFCRTLLLRNTSPGSQLPIIRVCVWHGKVSNSTSAIAVTEMCPMWAEIYSEGMLIPNDNSATFTVNPAQYHIALWLHKLHISTKSLCAVAQHSHTEDNYYTPQLFTFLRLFLSTALHHIFTSPRWYNLCTEFGTQISGDRP
jgi:hypothetical protein